MEKDIEGCIFEKAKESLNKIGMYAGEKEKTEKIKIDSDCANMESKKYTRIEVSVQETNIVYEGQITKWKESLGFRKVEQK